MKNHLLVIEGLAKRYSRSLKHSMMYGLTDMWHEAVGTRVPVENLRSTEFWALKNINFEMSPGESVGLVGANGSGKTTLLKLISGLVKPDQGSVKTRGRIAPLIALGAGFSPILTGRENIFVNMAILGLTEREIKDRFSSVIEFAEIGDAIDSPVQTYSSGMAARLGFSCAIHTAPDLLLIDEVLSVGDMRFRSKCYRRLAELKKNGTSFVLVSHNTNAIISMCDKVLYLNKGQEVMRGQPAEVMNRFERDLMYSGGQVELSDFSVPKKEDGITSGIDITSVYFTDENSSRVACLKTGEKMNFNVQIYSHKAWEGISLGFIIRQASGELEPVLNMLSERDSMEYSVRPGHNTLSCEFGALGLRPGVYSAKIYVSQKGLNIFDAVESFKFEVKSDRYIADSNYYQNRVWKLNEQ